MGCTKLTYQNFNFLEIVHQKNATEKKNRIKVLEYVYQYKDHLGNIRLSYSDADGNGSIDASTEIIEENNYYPFGLKHKGYNSNVSANSNSVASKFKYNGIELEEALGVNLYEMAFRQYDPAIGRFTSIDPVIHHYQSTYAAFDNNPIYWADPSGTISVSSLQEMWDATPEGGSSTWTKDGNGGFCQDCPKEGTERDWKRVVGYGHGAVAVDAKQYYHSGGLDNSKEGWYFEDEYMELFRTFVQTMAYTNRRDKANIPSTIEWVNSTELPDNLVYALGAWIESASQYDVVRNGMITPMELNSPFFIGLGMTSKFFLSSSSGYTTVGRWMSTTEYAGMKNGLPAAVGAGGKTSVTVGGSNVWNAASRGSVYVEFQVPTNSLVPGGGPGIYSILGPNASRSQMWMLSKLGGQTTPAVQNLTNILKVKL